jgi:lipoprotein-releasing system permease protein
VFNIFAMLTMTVVKKQTDIGLLQSVGANATFVRNIFLAEGLIIGIAGTIIGLLLGLGLCYGQIYFQWFTFDTQNFIIPAIPVKIAWIDVTAISVVTIVLSFLATIFPARRAAEANITTALRSE